MLVVKRPSPERTRLDNPIDADGGEDEDEVYRVRTPLDNVVEVTPLVALLNGENRAGRNVCFFSSNVVSLLLLLNFASRGRLFGGLVVLVVGWALENEDFAQDGKATASLDPFVFFVRVD